MEAPNFETVQHVDKQITDFSSTISALENGTKPGATTLRRPREKVSKLKIIRKNLRVLSSSGKFSAGRPLGYYRRIIFRAQWSRPLALIV